MQSRRAEAEVKRKYDEVMHFADIVRVGELIDQADRLWPAWPDRLAELRR